jgi:hypothetical protein
MRQFTSFAAAAAFVLAAAASASRADPHGPPFGANRYAASIARVCAEPDTDDYVAALVAGERLTVTVLASGGSALRPALTLVGPDGSEFAPSSLKVSRNGKSATLRSWPVPKSGRWAVRVAGAGGTEGCYTIAFAIGAAPPVSARKLDVTAGADCVVPFEGIDGAVVDLSVAWKTRGASVALSSILSPLRAALPNVVPVVTAHSLTVKGLVLAGGDGTYELHLARGAGLPVCDVSVRVRPTGRPKSARAVKLSDSEPFLDAVASPLRGAAGVRVRMTGGNLSASDPPTVLFGSLPAIAYVANGGSEIDVIPPDAAEGATVDVAVVGSDGQSCVRKGYFRYVPAPHVDDLVDDRHAPVRVLRSAGGASLLLLGSGFEEGQTVSFGAVPAEASVASPSSIRVTAPAVTGRVHVTVRDEFGRASASGFEVNCVAPPDVASVAATGGVFLDASHAAAGGGTSVTITGVNLLAADVVTFGRAPCAVTSGADGRLTFTTSALVAGPADLVVTDPVGQSTVIEKALNVVGFADATSTRSPGKNAADALAASRGAVGDLDGDGRADDLVLVSGDTPPGTRAEFTRVFFGSSGALHDVTATNVPAARSDAAGADEWKADAVAIGDLDGDGSADIVIGGSPVPGTGTDVFEARIFANDGAGTFHLDAASPLVRTAPWTVSDGSTDFDLFTPDGAGSGRVTALAVGDLDGDGAADMVIGTDHFRTGALHLPLSSVYFDGDTAHSPCASYAWDPVGVTTDSPALRICLNRRGTGEGLVDATFTRLPRGETSPGQLPAYHVRDLKLGDVNGDGALDIVLTWDDPTTVTPYGLANPGAGEARIATRVLLNDGAGFFTDATDSWMPAASNREFWQADRLVLADLDGDGDLDLVLLHHESTDAYTGLPTHSVSALRILRNDGPGAGFVDVTRTALPSVPLAGTTDDNLRGTALAVFDFDGDGVPDIAVGTTESLGGGAHRSTRLLRGLGGMKFADASGFLPAAATDSGEAGDILPVHLVTGTSGLSLLLVAPAQPAHSAGGEILRVLDWTK